MCTLLILLCGHTAEIGRFFKLLNDLSQKKIQIQYINGWFFFKAIIYQ